MQNKTIVIIGASSGIGHAIATELGLKGAKIYSISRSEPSLPTSMVYEHHNHDILEDSFPDNFLPDAIDGGLSRLR